MDNEKRGRGRPAKPDSEKGRVVWLRLKSKIISIADRIAAQNEESRSDVLRRWIRNGMSKTQSVEE